MRALAALALGLLVGAASGEAAELQRVPIVFHVHSDLSSGDRSIEELARTARAQGATGLMFAENYLQRAEYGLGPFRALTRVTYEERSVLAIGADKYLARVAQARRASPDVLLLPGVEVIPHYRWSGSPLGRSMMLYNTQKNVLVVGIEDPAALSSLPAIGNPHARRYGWQSLVDALPALLVIPGLLVLATRKIRRRRVGGTIVIVHRRRWLLGGVLVFVGLAAIVRGWPFSVDVYPSSGDFGVEPHQALIDHVERLGGATIWSFPEAWDEGQRSIGLVKVGWRTDPYPDDLLRTFRYTAFGALYEQTTRFNQPGGGWDRLLVEYAAGERSRPAWGVGESGFHAASTGKRLGAVQTVFLVPERTEAGVIDAFKHGRMYALQRAPDATLVLADWSVVAAGTMAVSGETLRVPEGTPIEVRIALDVEGTGVTLPRATLIRNGVVVNSWAGDDGVRATHQEVFDGKPVVFRLDARAIAPHRIVSNPIFVMRP